jgi:hypothetical protein
MSTNRSDTPWKLPRIEVSPELSNFLLQSPALRHSLFNLFLQFSALLDSLLAAFFYTNSVAFVKYSELVTLKSAACGLDDLESLKTKLNTTQPREVRTDCSRPHILSVVRYIPPQLRRRG